MKYNKMKQIQKQYIKILKQDINIDNIYNQMRYEKLISKVTTQNVIKYIKNSIITYNIDHVEINDIEITDSNSFELIPGTIYQVKNYTRYILPITYISKRNKTTGQIYTSLIYCIENTNSNSIDITDIDINKIIGNEFLQFIPLTHIELANYNQDLVKEYLKSEEIIK